MCRNVRHLLLSTMPALIAAFLLFTPVHAQEVSVVNASWEGSDYVIRFSDSLDYTVDLGASDSTLVLAFSRPIGVEEGTAKGPNGISATFSRNAGDSMVMLTVRGDQRVGYSTLWRPYSRRLIVHTFNWDSLEYGAEQYHKGLLSLEQKLPDQARSYLSSARAFDNGEIARRASSILGVLYAREGKDSLARLYLNAPYDADDFMARAEVSRRAGDPGGAMRDEETFRERMDQAGSLAEAPTDGLQGQNEGANSAPITKIFDDRRGILLVAIAAFLIIVLAVWFSRRPAAPRRTATHEPHGHDHPGPHESAPERRSPDNQTTTVTTPIPPATPPTPAFVHPEREERPETAPDPIISSLHAPEIVTQKPTVADEESLSRGIEPIELPHPDALPEKATETEVYETRVRAEADEAETAEAESRRGSAQADQLRRRMDAARSGAGQAPPAKTAAVAPSVEHESTVTEARRLNVSRDYVELRNRIAELRRRIDES